ncbi:MAG: hypothetical protein JXP36_14920 [Bacteroidales bacterium]|nr:hypothetical protein [Bacteroidales bacterium]
MKGFFKNIILYLLTFSLFSCSDDFVNEYINIYGVANSIVIISPEWEADDYQFEIERTGNAGFSIDSKPDWLVMNDNSGAFINDVATIRCKANLEPGFSKTGIYIDQMLISSNEKQYAVPVYYITEGNPSVQVSPNLEILYSNYSHQLEISNSGNGILLWDIVSMPDWLSVDRSQFNLNAVILGQGSTTSIPFIFNAEKAIQSNLTGTIVLKTNDQDNQQIDISVSANLGTPHLSIYSYYLPLDFGTAVNNLSLEIGNNGNGILAWRIEGLPEWLSVSASNGICHAYSDIEVNFTCDRSKLEAGFNTTTIYLKSSDPENPSYPITVFARAAGDNVNVRALEGDVVDATFDKNADILYYVTSLPNTLVAYDVTSRAVLYEIALNKAPTCLAASDDFKQALVGHGGMISLLDLDGQSVTKTIEARGVLADIEFAATGWCAYTEGGNYNIQHTTIYWVDLTNGDILEGSSVYEDCLIKKVPNQNYIIGSETEVSAGVYVYDINNRNEKADIFDSFDNFWFAGSYIISSHGHVYRISDLVSKDGYIINDLSPVGNIYYPDNNYYTIPWIDHCSATHSVFGLQNQDYQTISSQIYQFEDNDYTLTNTYYYDNLYQPDDQTTSYEVEAHYLFSNSSGTELSVLRKGKDNNNWSVEFVTVE